MPKAILLLSNDSQLELSISNAAVCSVFNLCLGSKIPEHHFKETVEWFRYTTLGTGT